MERILRVSNYIEIVIRGVVVAETLSAKAVAGKLFFPIGDVRTEYLSHSLCSPVIDCLGEAQQVNVEVSERIVERASRFYIRPRPRYTLLKEHITFDASLVAVYYIDGEKLSVWPPHPVLESMRLRAA